MHILHRKASEAENGQFFRLIDWGYAVSGVREH